ncbi:TD and POZ domain-containing protein 1-like protein, partial [Leptotrombidium deliense]
VPLFLRKCADKSATEIRANYAIHVLDAAGDKRFSAVGTAQGGRIFEANIEGHGFKHLAPRSSFLENEQRMLSAENTLTLLVEITAYGDFKSKYTSSNNGELYAKSEMEQFSFLSDMEKVFLSMDNADMNIITSDGKTFQCHKLLLANRFKVFEAMMSHDNSEKASDSIKIDDFESPVVEQMLQFLYTDN